MIQDFKFKYVKLYNENKAKKFIFSFIANNKEYEFTKILYKDTTSREYIISVSGNTILCWDNAEFIVVDLNGDDYEILKEVLPKYFNINIPIM
jgi:hypothetical protein